MFVVWDPFAQKVVDYLVPAMRDWALMAYPQFEVYSTAVTARPSALPTDAALVTDFLRDYAAQRRDTLLETGSVPVAGVSVEIGFSGKSRSRMSGYAGVARQVGTFSVVWTEDGQAVSLSAQDIMNADRALLSRMASVWASYSTAVQAISAGTLTTRSAVDAAIQ